MLLSPLVLTLLTLSTAALGTDLARTNAKSLLSRSEDTSFSILQRDNQLQSRSKRSSRHRHSHQSSHKHKSSAHHHPKSKPQPQKGQNSVLDETHSGDGTFFAVGLGACGYYNKDSDFIVAVSHLLYDTFEGGSPGGNPNNNPICGRKVTASYGGASVTVEIVDRCAGCAGKWDLDFSPAAFDKLADPSVGRLHDVQWSFD